MRYIFLTIYKLTQNVRYGNIKTTKCTTKRRDNVDKEKIKSKLVELRKAKNKSRNQMAADLGLSYLAIASYEEGVRIPRDEIKKQIAEYFNTTVQDIFFN
jgi:putative transcriptional regulator